MNHIGDVLYNIRKSKKISQISLCKGLCTTAAFSRYENGARVPDRLLLQSFFQRLGVSPDLFLTTLSEPEYAYFQLKARILEELSNNQWERAKQLLNDPLAKDVSCNYVLQKQFYIFANGVILEQLEKDYAKASACIKEAINLTVADVDQSIEQNDLLSTVEINMILVWIETEILYDNDKSEKVHVLRKVIRYIDLHFVDELEKLKVYLKATLLLIKYIDDREEAALLCKNVFKVLRSQHSLIYMDQILEIMIRIPNENSVKLEKQRESLLSIYKDYDQRLECSYTGIGDSKQEIYLINEVIRNSRMRSKISQERLSEGICTVETYSRIETGKRAPTNKNYAAITKKLEMDWSYYQSIVESDNISVIKMASCLSKASIHGEFENMEYYLIRLKNELDLTNTKNLQFYQLHRNSLDYRKKIISAEELLRRDLELLHYSVSEKEEIGQFRLLTNTEIALLVNISVTYHFLEKDENAVEILKGIINNYQNSKVALSDHREQIVPVLSNLNNLLTNLKCYDEAIYYADLGISINLKCNVCDSTLIGCIMGKAYALELKDRIKNKESCARLYRQAFYLSDLVNEKINHEIVKEHYESEYDSCPKWY